MLHHQVCSTTPSGPEEDGTAPWAELVQRRRQGVRAITGVGNAGFCTGSHRSAEPYIAPWSSRCLLALDRVTPMVTTLWGHGTAVSEVFGDQDFEKDFVVLVPAQRAQFGARCTPNRPRSLVGPRLAGRRPSCKARGDAQH